MQRAIINYAGVSTQLMVHDNEYISNVIRAGGSFFEQPVLEWIRANFPKQDTIIDIGANIGNHARFFLDHLQLNRLICFEPFPANFEILKLNVGERAEVLPVALSSSERTCGMTYTPDNLGMCFLDDSIPGEIKVRTLDSYNFDRVTMIKMDVESHHTEVVKGMLDTLQRCRPALFLEGNFDELFPLVQPYGYVCVQMWHRFATYCFVRMLKGER